MKSISTIQSSILAMLLLACTIPANSKAPQNKTSESKQSESILLEYSQGFLTAFIKDTPISKVLSALEEKADVHFRLHSPDMDKEPITMEFKNLPLHEGLTNILGGYSYVLEDSDGKINVTMLTSAQDNNKIENSTLLTTTDFSLHHYP
jgi:hypothetical protein